MSYTYKDNTDEVLCMQGGGGDLNELDYEGQYR